MRAHEGQRVVSRSGNDARVAAAAVDQIVAEARVDRVPARPTDDRVDAGAGRDRRCAVSGLDEVAGIVARDRIGAHRAADEAVNVGDLLKSIPAGDDSGGEIDVHPTSGSGVLGEGQGVGSTRASGDGDRGELGAGAAPVKCVASRVAPGADEDDALGALEKVAAKGGADEALDLADHQIAVACRSARIDHAGRQSRRDAARRVTREGERVDSIGASDDRFGRRFRSPAPAVEGVACGRRTRRQVDRGFSPGEKIVALSAADQSLNARNRLETVAVRAARVDHTGREIGDQGPDGVVHIGQGAGPCQTAEDRLRRLGRAAAARVEGVVPAAAAGQDGGVDAALHAVAEGATDDRPDVREGLHAISHGRVGLEVHRDARSGLRVGYGVQARRAADQRLRSDESPAAAAVEGVVAAATAGHGTGAV